MPLDPGRVTHLIDQMHRSEDDAGDPIAAGMLLAADGARGQEWVDPTTIGGGLPWFDVMQAPYNATNNGTTDDTSAINSAIAALNTAGFGVLYFPGGTGYKITAGLTTITAVCLVMGDGRGSKITSNHATASTMTIAASGVTVRDLFFDNTASPPTAGAGLTCTSGGNLNRYENLTVTNYYNGIDHQSGIGWAILNPYIESVRNYGIRISNATPDAGDWNILGGVVSDAATRSAAAGIRIDSSGGGKITGLKVNAGAAASGYLKGIDVSMATGVGTSVLLIGDCSIENVRGDAIGITTTGTGKYGLVAITGNQVALYSNNTGRAVKISAATNGTFGTNGAIGIVVIDGLVARTDGTARAAIELVNTDLVTLGEMALSGFNARYTSSGDTNTVDSGVGVTFGTPALTLSTSNAAGSASTAIRTDATLLAFDATVPITQAFSDTAATGSAAVAARRDHKHGMPVSPTVTAGVLLIADTHSTPIVFADVILTEAQDDFLYSD